MSDDKIVPPAKAGEESYEDIGDNAYCSFCGKKHTEVLVLIAGPACFICDECVEICRDVVGEKRARLGNNGYAYPSLLAKRGNTMSKDMTKKTQPLYFMTWTEIA